MIGGVPAAEACYPHGISKFKYPAFGNGFSGGRIELVNIEKARSEFLKMLLAPLRESYDYILIDCPRLSV